MRLFLLLVKWYKVILDSITTHCFLSIDLRTYHSTISSYTLYANITITLHKKLTSTFKEFVMFIILSKRKKIPLLRTIVCARKLKPPPASNSNLKFLVQWEENLLQLWVEKEITALNHWDLGELRLFLLEQNLANNLVTSELINFMRYSVFPTWKA